jgi:hypothetical protein
MAQTGADGLHTDSCRVVGIGRLQTAALVASSLKGTLHQQAVHGLLPRHRVVLQQAVYKQRPGC